MFNSMDDFITNTRSPDGGAAIGMVDSNVFQGGSWDPGLSRPYLVSNGKAYVDVTTGWKNKTDKNGQIIYNASK